MVCFINSKQALSQNISNRSQKICCILRYSTVYVCVCVWERKFREFLVTQAQDFITEVIWNLIRRCSIGGAPVTCPKKKRFWWEGHCNCLYMSENAPLQSIMPRPPSQFPLFTVSLSPFTKTTITMVQMYGDLTHSLFPRPLIFPSLFVSLH